MHACIILDHLYALDSSAAQAGRVPISCLSAHFSRLLAQGFGLKLWRKGLM